MKLVKILEILFEIVLLNLWKINKRANLYINYIFKNIIMNVDNKYTHISVFKIYNIVDLIF